MASDRVSLATFLNLQNADAAPGTVAFKTTAAAVAAYYAFQALHDGDLPKRGLEQVLRVFRLVAAPYLRKEVAKAGKSLMFEAVDKKYRTFESIPEQGLPLDELKQTSQALTTALDKDMAKERLSGAVYVGSLGKSDAITAIIKDHLWSNPLFAEFFGATRKMEAEVVQMLLELFHGKTGSHVMESERQVGCYSFGGSESVIMAMLAMRNYAQRERGIARPNVVLPTSAHPAFDKAGVYFNIRLVKVPLRDGESAVRVEDMEKYITYETIGIVGSAPQFAHGTMDPIEELAALAIRKNILFHVDACLGGMIIQFLERAGRPQPIIDFRLPGVTSISCDIHKWGGAPKGSSVVLYKGAWLRKHQTFTFPDYPGGLYVTSGVNGSKPGYVIAGAWATILSTGKQEYIENVRAVTTVIETFRTAVESTPLLYVLGNPHTVNVAFTSDVLDIYKVKEIMGKRSWIFNALQFPAALHLGVTLEHAKPGALATLIKDLSEVVEEMAKELGFESAQAAEDAFKSGKLKINQKHDSLMYGSTQSVPDRKIIEQVLMAYIDNYYVNTTAGTKKEVA